MSADWAILIVTLVRRRGFYDRLMRRLAPQVEACGGRVAVYSLEDSGAENIGIKRQRMIETVTEPYLNFVDDDDLVSEDYVSSVCEALDAKPDVVGFRLRYFVDGILRGRSVTSVKCRRWYEEKGEKGMRLHFRTPNHLNPVRSEMARSIGFKPMQAGEDADYSQRLFKKYPEMNEVFIDKYLYDYLYRSPSERREGAHLAVT